MTQECSKIYFKVILILETASKVNVWVQKLTCSYFQKLEFSVFRQKLTFRITNLTIHLVEYVHIDHTDHFRVR